MKSYGIKIPYEINPIISPTLADVLEVLEVGDLYSWSILFIDGMLNPEKNYSIFDFKKKINKSEDGMQVKWDQLILFSGVFFQIYQTTVIGSKDPKWLRRKYVGEENVYETCDFVLTFIDCAFWEIYSKDLNFIEQLRKKFKKTEPLELPKVE